VLIEQITIITITIPTIRIITAKSQRRELDTHSKRTETRIHSRTNRDPFSLLRHLDQTFAAWGIIALILFTPLVVGSVEPWAFVLIEAAILLMLVSLLVRYLVVEGESHPGIGQLIMPAGLFLALVAFEMVPLPPAIERTISPSTFDFYQNSLSRRAKGTVDARPLTAGVRSAIFAVLPTSAEISEGSSIPFVTTPTQGSKPTGLELSLDDARAWHPLSLDNSLTGPAVLKILVYVCLFLLIVTYPRNDDDGFGFAKMLVRAVLIAGILTAVVALLGRVFPNGKVLWVFTPYDWPNGNPWGSRATSPFANPDHLADYLDMVLPIAVIGFLRPSVFNSERRSAGRIFCGVAVLLVGSSLLLTSSRAGWLGASIALALLIKLLRRRQERRRIPLATGMVWGGSLGVLLLSVLLIVGPGGRKQTDLRLEQTVAQNSLASRLEPTKRSLKMIEDFPIFGVGLGCWPQIFPHYAQPPWSPIFWNAMHNDYAQLAAETGLIGFGLVAWFFAATFIRAWRGTFRIKQEPAVLAAGCIAGMNAVGVHEFFDFSLQTPANALLFTVLLGLTARLTQHKPQRSLAASSISGLGLRVIALAGAIALIPAALTQGTVPYPYNIRTPATLAVAYSLVNAHPANATVHLMAARLLDAGPLEYRIEELRSALWLEPINPSARDLYAQTLLRLGKKEEALDQIRLSVMYSPLLSSHLYLRPRIIPWLSGAERAAVERGLRIALTNHYQGAASNLGIYYDVLSKFSAEAGVYYGAAIKEQDPVLRAGYFVDAGSAYARAGESQKAQISFLAAAAAAPEDSNPYEQLVLQVFGPQNNFAAAKATVSRAIQNGVDPFKLYLALGWAAQKSGNNGEAEAALQEAVAMRPSSAEALVRLGEVELATNRFDRAADWLRTATELDPSSAGAFYDLGLANEGAYEYFAADQAFEQALALAPKDEQFKAHYAAFRLKIMQNQHSNSKPRTTNAN
jgi:O-antigen ligase/tetratricopeptide (TPR) repeat protein